MKRIYGLTNVYEEAVKRISYILDEFEEVVISISGGKDSTVLFDIAYREAIKKGKVIKVFFLDQEAEYQSTIEVIKSIMYRKNIKPFWFQVPIYMTNATSHIDCFLYAWGEGEEWMREKDPIAIHKITEEYPKRFYKFLDWFSQKWKDKKSCFLVGLRAEESLNRYRAVIKNPGYKNITWTTHTKGVINAYPLYDWTFEDVWKYIYDHKLKYNRIYDFLYMKGYEIQNVRVSNLIHEKSFRCLANLQEFEPDTYDKLVKRLKGIHVAARYAKENMVYSSKKLPPRFKSWKQYRDFLIDTIPEEHKDRFIKRFAKQGQDEYIYRQQCRQIMIHDWENNISIQKRKNQGGLERWKKIL